ncbi:conserved hypothetical protein [Vibrio nigripulchritudo SOn1]|uniref:N-acetyltransferase domain-containing protein n=2 Tax=Vibrio nigripulchritudo TaxID=28173 RepID=A0AAV2VYB9_9VIBR|nr:conserved hypothetical protein [Vibrio nigripulchritudo SOn1]
MGYDTWSQNKTKDEYLIQCSESKKYQSGVWYVLLDNDRLISSLIVYSSGFSLPIDSYGIGSISTENSLRNKGFASFLIDKVVNELLSNRSSIFLHSDIDYSFYEKFGFRQIDESSCMVKNKGNLKSNIIPSYF